MLRNTCPICENSSVVQVREDLAPHPYLGCATCGFWYQRELKPKVYEASHEAPGDSMSQHDKDVNRDLARRIFDLTKPTSSLDIGAKYPYLAHCFGELGVEAWAIDGIPEIMSFSQGLKVSARPWDFEDPATVESLPQSLGLITMIHMIEHLYRPILACVDVYNLLAPGGHFFIRCPANDVRGIDRDFTPGHFTIHPQIWGKRSLEFMAKKVGFQIVQEYAFEPGQRDMLLRKPTE